LIAEDLQQLLDLRIVSNILCFGRFLGWSAAVAWRLWPVTFRRKGLRIGARGRNAWQGSKRPGILNDVAFVHTGVDVLLIDQIFHKLLEDRIELTFRSRTPKLLFVALIETQRLPEHIVADESLNGRDLPFPLVCRQVSFALRVIQQHLRRFVFVVTMEAGSLFRRPFLASDASLSAAMDALEPQLNAIGVGEDDRRDRFGDHAGFGQGYERRAETRGRQFRIIKQLQRAEAPVPFRCNSFQRLFFRPTARSDTAQNAPAGLIRAEQYPLREDKPLLCHTDIR
jgi:hypothetical protein